MKYDDSSFDAAIHAHDEAMKDCGLDVWIGAEPTFTNRRSDSPEWLTDALGDTKQNFACQITKRLHESSPGAIILRTLGRQYPGEEYPRWSIGLYQRRDLSPLAEGLPMDPLDAECSDTRDSMIAFWRSLTEALNRDGWCATAFQCDGEMGLRVLFRVDGVAQLVADPEADTRLARASFHTQAIPPSGAVDDLAGEGLYLIALGFPPIGLNNSLQPCMELPGFADVVTFLNFVERVGTAAHGAGLTELVWQGFPPPVNKTVAWTTLTPDPAVLEINAAPVTCVSDFLAVSRRLFDAAESAGLSPYRLQYNGEIQESGGCGQFTLGGPSPTHSPFFVEPQLLGRLVSYFNRHPALSYWFAPLYIGSSSQSPRADENVLEFFTELQVALQQLAATAEPDPEFIWRSLSPFLVDTSGNAHRSELNIEKLWNPHLPGRGCLGLVEFRAFRMTVDAETAASIAAMLRALVAMLSKQDESFPLIEWGSRLHDRFALPFYLRLDLQTVLDDLNAAGVGLETPITERLLNDNWRHVGQTEFSGCRLDVERAIEFWPLLGDTAAHTGGSRLVDASTTRLQISLRLLDGQAADLNDWQVLVGRFRIPMRLEQDEAGALLIMGLRYRAFVPWTGLHPGIGAQGPIILTLIPPGATRGVRVTLHEWQPDGGAYDGLPESIDAARQRASERFVVEEIRLSDLPEALAPPATSLSEYCFDLRRT